VLDAGDYVDCAVLQTSRGNLDVALASQYSPELAAIWQGTG
jgi:hypothetical protein